VNVEPRVVTPELQQKTMWFLGWSVLFVIVLVGWLVLLLVLGKPVFGFCALGWVVLMLPFLPWIPAYYRSLEYVIDRDSVKMKKGVFWRRRVAVPYPKITNVDITQGPVQRHFNIGTIHVQTAGASGSQATTAELKLMGVRELEGLKDLILDRVKAHAASPPAPVVRDTGEGIAPQGLREVLQELRAIRQALEGRQE
jgi:membrane protein YdbS with pleckstrin-like domain